MCVFVIKHNPPLPLPHHQHHYHQCKNRASCCSIPALPTPWLGVPTASWWVAATRRWWPTAGRVTSCRPSTTTTTAQRRSSQWRPPAPAASRWCLAASTGQLCQLCQQVNPCEEGEVALIPPSSLVFVAGCGCSTGPPGGACGTRPSPKRFPTSTPSPACPGRKTARDSAL